MAAWCGRRSPGPVTPACAARWMRDVEGGTLLFAPTAERPGCQPRPEARAGPAQALPPVGWQCAASAHCCRAATADSAP